MPNVVEVHQKFPLDGRMKAVEINVVSNGGLCWINVMNTNWFGLKSSAWLGRTSRKKQGLRKQAEKILRAAKQNLIDGQEPKVIFEFTNVVSREVAEELTRLGAYVEGTIVDPRGNIGNEII